MNTAIVDDDVAINLDGRAIVTRRVERVLAIAIGVENESFGGRFESAAQRDILRSTLTPGGSGGAAILIVEARYQPVSGVFSST